MILVMEAVSSSDMAVPAGWKSAGYYTPSKTHRDRCPVAIGDLSVVFAVESVETTRTDRR